MLKLAEQTDKNEQSVAELKNLHQKEACTFTFLSQLIHRSITWVLLSKKPWVLLKFLLGKTPGNFLMTCSYCGKGKIITTCSS